MNIFIIEDEPLAVQKLTKLLFEVAPHVQIEGTADGIESSVEWLQTHPTPDLLLMDIELCDGQSFEIFNQIEVKSPVIFTTSYDEYAIQAFKVNSVDYLLKPIKREDLERALQKYEKLNRPHGQAIDISRLINELQKQNQPKEYRTRFLVKQGQRLLPVETTDIAYFFSEDGLTFFMTRDRIRHLLDYTLEELDTMLDPKQFFRISRQFILEVRSVTQIHNHFNGKLKLDLRPSIDKEVTVSRERVSDFKDWMGR
ncbi:LytR/AlgR family response regulator transcription factor [Runella slithyformis]|uniref:Two component transcriptional regulator, LytTR family n=1 Tax=Runella slithyformis (strain ATCC 29530 / DSM 19594 / LMG 11500 / NCIMB 11436 / LSU 4) TaxID=761193 RepID=A0A7U3ZRG1_RUNSL|nr:LytTR family DNA-binding domain-containing protein [Runella slithyformis]AEI51968.1 two component transcriptional regulator, LytTR family [Runella slithyformis DSM 19594]